VAHIMVQRFHQCRAVERTINHIVRTRWNAAHARLLNVDSSDAATVMNSTIEQKILSASTFPCTNGNTMICATENKVDY
jgi:hypothetical protein